MLIVQGVMAALGLLLMLSGGLGFGRKQISKPIAVVMGLVLIAPLPLCLLIGGAVGMSEGWNDAFRSVRGNITAGEENWDRDAALKQRDFRNLALSLVVSGMAVLGSVVLLFVGLQDKDAGLPADALSLHGIAAGPPTAKPSAELPLLPALPPEVRQYQADAHSVPLEVEALGKAKQLHPPQRLPALLRNYAAALFLLGLALLCAALGLLLAVPLTALGMQLVILGGLLGLGILAAPLLAGRKAVPTYIVFRDALLQVRGNTFTVIPWSAVAEFHVGRKLVAVDGAEFDLDGKVTDRERLEGKLMAQVTAHRLPALLDEVQAGKEAAFGPFTLRADGLAYRGKTLAWENAAHVRIRLSVQPPVRQLAVRKRGSTAPWCQGSLDFPNDFLFLELVRRVCPPRLLAPEEQP